MNSAELPTFSSTSNDTSGWDAVRRIYRRMCLLQATGRKAEAAALERTELPSAIAAARVTAPVVAEAALLAEETERVASAAVLAELLAPLLAERIASAAPRESAPASALRATRSEPAPGHGLPSSADAATPPPPAAVPGIADLIDGMLSQQSASSRSSAR